MKKRISLFASFCSAAMMAQAQLVVSGQVTDRTSGETLPMAPLTLVQAGKDTLYTTTDLDGNYCFDRLPLGDYQLEARYLGYKTVRLKLALNADKKYVFDVQLEEEVQKIGKVNVEARATRAQQRGDTLAYNASAFKVLEGSNTEDLLAKMPGIVVEGGEVQAQGEAVQKILVDGKEFFDGDVNLALKNLPSDIVASIEVFDKKSDQAEFTGFDDGEEIKTINIVTKPEYREGLFGKVYGGYGLDNRYNAGGNVNWFDDTQRVSVLGMSNNVNQQNFSQEDLAGVMSSQSSKRSGRRGGRGGGGGRGGSASTDNFMVGSLGGLTQTNGLGVNYVNEWDKRLKLTASYFLNQTNNDYEENLVRKYFDSVLPGMTYEQDSESDMNNWNHRINMNLDYQIDDRNSLQIRPKFSFQRNDTYSLYDGQNLLNGIFSEGVNSVTDNLVKAWQIGGDATYRHRFNTEGRTLSLSFRGQYSDRNGGTYTDYLERKMQEEQLSEEAYSQYKDMLQRQMMFRTNLMFTEKLGDQVQVQANYKMSYTNTDAEQKTYESNGTDDLYEQLVEDLSNVYQTDYITQAGGLGLRWNVGKLRLMAGAEMQWSTLQGEETYPYAEQLKHTYFSVLPSFTARYMADRNNSFQLRYRSSSTAPSLQDLQHVINNTNLLFLSTGNPDLDQQINHTLNLRYLHTTLSGQTVIAMVGATFRTDYVADSTFVATEDQMLPGGIQLDKGAQFTKPVNMDGYYSLQSMLTYGFPVDWLRSNVNLSLSANYAHVPTIFNGVTNYTHELTLVPKLVIGSNISEKLDFTVSYSSGINRAFSSQSETQASDYVMHTAQGQFGWNFWKDLTFRTSMSYIGYTGLESEASNYLLWNASIGMKFLKNKAAEIRLEAYDLLQQAQSFRQSVSSSYYDYLTANVLQPYAMLTFVYTIR